MGHANFHNPLQIKSNGRKVDAWGPNEWEPGDTWMEISAVTITQGDAVASSTGTTIVDTASNDWWLEAKSDKPLRTGHAIAEAIAIIHSEDGDVVRYPWTERVWLEQPRGGRTRAKPTRKRAYRTTTRTTRATRRPAATASE
jgi:hypothetical protein